MTGTVELVVASQGLPSPVSWRRGALGPARRQWRGAQPSTATGEARRRPGTAMDEALVELLGAEAPECTLANDGSGIGAALLAAVSVFRAAAVGAVFEPRGGAVPPPHVLGVGKLTI